MLGTSDSDGANWCASSDEPPVEWHEHLLIGSPASRATASPASHRRPRILLVGHGHDPDLAALGERLSTIGADVHALLVDRISHYPSMRIPGDVASETFDVGYCRSFLPSDTIQYHFDRTARRSPDWSAISPDMWNYAADQASVQLWYWLGRQRVGRWINSPWKLRSAENKLRQLATAAEIGLQVPDTIVTNDPETLRSFARRHRDGVIHKSLGSPVALRGSTAVDFHYTATVDPSTITTIPCPSLFQRRLRPNSEVRATFIGDRVFSASVPRSSAAAPDWRRSTDAHADFEHHTLPGDVISAIRALMKALEIEVGAVDLIETEEGIHFLEVNPSAALLWLERSLGMRLCDTLANTILSAKPPTRSFGEQSA